MPLIKTTKDQVILFDENEILFINGSSINKEHRIFSMIFIFSIAIVGIIINLSDGRLYSLLAFLALLLYGVIYLFFHFFNTKILPEQLFYADIEKIDFVTSKKQAVIIYRKEFKPLKFIIKNLDASVIQFLESKNHFIVNMR